ncbi:ABC transporter ATP-binding protein [Pseudenhygromyxa sp. WMMC2535]|uniref:ABC transporter ATP-binding protein n=1 Tax=Pseudenhygromyxa sp. WMMC2535 TaxID=2712867 RepID=UPI0015549984|nr:ABC transporter ATP-binding protein [Pseudenhygromyxa sp. WMMC2535]NVB37445.1 ABC transporter ATP-binding protein [Pseudenhygromyxa sp. WMMC2535]
MSEQGTSQSAWDIMEPVKAKIRFAMGLSIASSLATLGALGFLSLTLAALMRAHEAEWPWVPLVGALVCTVAAYVLRSQSFNQSHYAAFRLENLLRTRLAAHLGTLSLGETERIGASALSKIIHDDVKALHVFVADSTPLYARAYAIPLVTLGLLLYLDWRLALAATAVLVAGFAGASLMMHNVDEMFRRYTEAREHVTTAVVEFVQAMPVVRTFDTGVSTFGRYERSLGEYRDVVIAWYGDSAFSGRVMNAALGPVPTLTVVSWLGAVFFLGGSLDAPAWIGVLLFCTGMAEAMAPAMMLKRLVETVKLSVVRIQEVLALPSLPTPAQSGPPQDASVRFTEVSFRYGEAESDALRDVSFYAGPGTVTALVGPSGAGKTTVARLIPRFWDATGGSVEVGGVDVRELSTDALMQHVSFVFQDTFLFSGTLVDNIRLGAPDATMEDVVAATEAAQAHDFIQALPNGYETQVGERGLFLSGGQRQRITIARSILQNRPILVLDEATAFADPENEAALVTALSELMQGKTVLLIAHRLSTIRDADQILVFDGGALVEHGRHDALVAADGVYSALWKSYLDAQHWTLGARSSTEASP